MAENSINWEGKTRGGNFGQKSIVVFLKIFHIRIIYFFIYFFAIYYMLVSRKGYKAIYFYFSKILKYNSLKSFWKVFKNHYLFGQIIIDRFASFSGAQINFKIETEGKYLFDNLLAQQTGGVIVSTHAGNFELAGYLMKLGNYKMNGVIFGPVQGSLVNAAGIVCAAIAGYYVALRTSSLLELDKTIERLPAWVRHFRIGSFAFNAAKRMRGA